MKFFNLFYKHSELTKKEENEFTEFIQFYLPMASTKVFVQVLSKLVQIANN